MVAEELDLVHEQLAFALLGVQMVLPQSRQCRAHIALVLLQCAAVDDDVVQEDEDAAIEQVAEALVHQVLEGGWRVGQPHRQHCPLEVTVASAECRLLAVCLGQWDLVEARAQVDLAEVLGSLQPVEQIVSVRQRVAVAYRQVVQPAIVDAEAERAILLLGEDDVGAPRRLGGAQAAAVQVLL